MNNLVIPSPIHYAIIDSTSLGDRTKWNYKRAIDRLIAAKVNPLNREQLASYASTLPLSIRRDTRAALNILYSEQKINLEASANVTNLAQVQSALLNLKAMTATIQTRGTKGNKLHNRLSKTQVDQITALPDLSTLAGRRDYIVLAVLLGAGLRREEMEELTFDALKTTPDSKGNIVNVLEIQGKGDKFRVIPISPLLAQHLREWKAETGSGRVARSITKGGTLKASLSEIGIFQIVRKYGTLIGVPSLAPHDCRRTFGRLAYDLTHDIILVKDLLGHDSVETTQDYIGLNQTLDAAPSDFIIRPFRYMEVSGD